MSWSSIGWVLSVYKDDAEVERELTALMLPHAQAVIPVLLGLRFDKFHALSLKALRQIVPHMGAGCATTRRWGKSAPMVTTVNALSLAMAKVATCHRSTRKSAAAPAPWCSGMTSM